MGVGAVDFKPKKWIGAISMIDAQGQSGTGLEGFRSAYLDNAALNIFAVTSTMGITR